MRGKVLLITGAAGYIGSHAVEELIESDEPPIFDQLVFLDDLSSGHLEFIDTLKRRAKSKKFPDPEFLNLSLSNLPGLTKVFENFKPDAVMHFAAKISVAESVANPGLYFTNNVTGSKNLIQAMKSVGTKKIVFSSTAAVYGEVQDAKLAMLPLDEELPLRPINPYGESKLQIESALREAATDWGLSSVIFRYFNAAGASLSGDFGEWHEPETHLIPLVLRAAKSGIPLQIFGTDYATRDGSCIRDYIHVSDLARAHLLGLRLLEKNEAYFTRVFNLGTANGVSVLEVIQAAEVVTGRSIQTEIKKRRAGDSEVLIANSNRARAELGWKPVYSDLKTLIQTAFDWEKSQKRF